MCISVKEIFVFFMIHLFQSFLNAFNYSLEYSLIMVHSFVPYPLIIHSFICSLVNMYRIGQRICSRKEYLKSGQQNELDLTGGGTNLANPAGILMMSSFAAPLPSGCHRSAAYPLPESNRHCQR